MHRRWRLVAFAVMLHLQKFWIVSIESNVWMALERRFEGPHGVKLALERHFEGPNGVKFALERRFPEPLDA